jgi:hypothetical protein
METELKPTVASEIVLPVRPKFLLIELNDLFTATGARAVVRCDRCEEVLILRHLGLPGARPGIKVDEGEQKVSQVEFILRNCAPVVHTATSFATSDGGEVRPAFHCDEEHAVPGSVPWDLTSLSDKLGVIQGLLELSGFGGAANATFPAGGSGGRAAGVGALAGVEGDGEGAEGLASGS